MLLRERSRGGGVLVAWTIAAAVPAVPITVATAAVAPSTAMLIPLALGPRATTLALNLTFRRRLMKLGSLAAGHGRLLRTRLLSLLLLALRLAAFIAPVMAWPALISPVGTPILPLTLAVALLLAVTTATLLEPAVLLAVAAPSFATVAPITSPVAALVAVAPARLLITPMFALLLRLGLGGRRRRRGRRGGSEEGAEEAR